MFDAKSRKSLSSWKRNDLSIGSILISYLTIAIKKTWEFFSLSLWSRKHWKLAIIGFPIKVRLFTFVSTYLFQLPVTINIRNTPKIVIEFERLSILLDRSDFYLEPLCNLLAVTKQTTGVARGTIENQSHGKRSITSIQTLPATDFELTLYTMDVSLKTVRSIINKFRNVTSKSNRFQTKFFKLQKRLHKHKYYVDIIPENVFETMVVTSRVYPLCVSGA